MEAMGVPARRVPHPHPSNLHPPNIALFEGSPKPSPRIN